MLILKDRGYPCGDELNVNMPVAIQICGRRLCTLLPIVVLTCIEGYCGSQDCRTDKSLSNGQ